MTDMKEIMKDFRKRRRVLIPVADIPERKEMKKPDDEIKEYVDKRVRDLDRKLSSVILKGVDLDRELSTVGRGVVAQARKMDRFSDNDNRIRDLGREIAVQARKMDRFSDNDNRIRDLDRKLSTVGRGLLEHNRRIDGLSDYLREEIDKYISKINGRLEGGWKYKVDNCVREEVKKQVTRINGDLEVLLESGIGDTVDELVDDVSRLQKEIESHKSYTKPDSKQNRTITAVLYEDNQENTFIKSFDELEDKLTDLVDTYAKEFESIEDKLTEIEEKYRSAERRVEQEPNNFPESSQELTNSNYSLEDVLAIPTTKPKIKKRRGKENKITLIYDSPNPAKVELRPKDIGSLELTIYSRGMDAQEIREKTLVFDPYNPETNEKNVEIFLDETEAHYADNTLDSLIVSLNNPELNKYFGKHMSPHFKKIYDLMTDELNSEFKGENKDLTSKLKRVHVERNKKRSGYGAFSSGKKLFGVISPILFPLKLFAYLGRIIE